MPRHLTAPFAQWGLITKFTVLWYDKRKTEDPIMEENHEIFPLQLNNY